MGSVHTVYTGDCGDGHWEGGAADTHGDTALEVQTKVIRRYAKITQSTSV